MLDELFHVFEKEFSLKMVGEVLSKINEIVSIFGEEYLKDKNLKNAAIDGVIKILEDLKDPQPNEPVTK